MYGVYLKCDNCGKTIGGEDVTEKLQGIPTLTRFEGPKLRELAGIRGWAHALPDTDTCPICAMFFAMPVKALDTEPKPVV